MPNAASRTCLHHFVNVLLWLLIFSIGGGVATLQAQEARRILVLGDSLSAAFGLSSEQGWPALLDQQLKSEPKTRHWEVVNASVSGETTAGGSARIEQAINAHAPDIVAIELGANDGLRGLPLDQAERHLARIITLSQTANAKVLLIGMRIPPNYGPEYTAEFEAMFARFTTFVEQSGIGPVAVNQWELTYINSFPQDEYWQTPADWSQILPGLFGSLFPTDGLGMLLVHRGPSGVTKLSRNAGDCTSRPGPDGGGTTRRIVCSSR